MKIDQNLGIFEKIWWGFLANTISIYCDPDVYETFNQGSLINMTIIAKKNS